MKKISIVIPTYNEQENVGAMTEKLTEIMNTSLPQYDYEIIFIDNHSKDGTRKILRRLCAADKKVKAILMRANFGQRRSPFTGLSRLTRLWPSDLTLISRSS